MESAAMTDDGDRERILAALRDSEQRFRMLFERNAAGMNIADLSGRYLQVNKAFCEFLGRSSRELLELRHQDVVHPGDLDEVRGNMAEGGAKEVLRRFVRKDGSTVWGVLSAALVRPETGPPYWVGVVQDITARKLAEESLRHSEERFRALANDTSAYLWILSFENGEHRLFINQRVADFAGVDTQYLGQNWINYVHPEDRKQVLQEFSAAISEGRPFSLECRFRRSDGEYRWVLDRGVPRYNSTTGELTGYGGSLVDITERRHAEQQVIALSDRLISVQEEERSRIAAELHDGFGQQIAAASMLLSGIKRRLSEPRPSLQREIEEIENARGRLQAIGDMIRNVSHRLHPAILKYAGLTAAIRAHCAEFTTLTGVSVRVSADEDFRHLPDVVSLSLYRVVQEALQNVAKHASAASADVRLTGRAGSVCLAVTDTGIGFDLQRVNSSSSGLGLVSMRERVRAIGGSFELRSNPNAGTAVRVWVPLHVSAAAGAPVSSVNLI